MSEEINILNKGAKNDEPERADNASVEMSADDTELALEVATEAGHILLENGAEVFRVEETMDRIAGHYGAESKSFFVLSNGIFTTGGSKASRKSSLFSDRHVGQYANVQYIPVKGTQLDKVVAVNQLSREIEENKYTIEQAKQKLDEIRNMPGKPYLTQVLASGIGSACFCLLFGGGASDCAVAFIAGLMLYIFMLYAGIPKMSKIMGNICGGALVTIICIICYRIGFGKELSYMIIGSIIPLVPGVPFTNGIRDIADGDYISGAVRLLDAILVFLCVAIGVGVVFTVYERIIGGIML